MAKVLRPIVRSGGFYPSRKYTPLVYPGGYTTLNAKNGKPDPLNTISGSIVRFISNHVKPFVKTVVNIDPVQDLHGYDNPWPAGGGANLIGFSDATAVANGTNRTLTVKDEVLTVDVTGATSSSLIVAGAGMTATIKNAAIKAGTYTFKVFDFSTDIAGLISSNVQIGIRDSSENVNYYIANTPFTLAEDQTIASIGYASTIQYTSGKKISFKAMLVSGSTLPDTWTPYSNLCPISGWTGANVWDDPKYGGNINWNQVNELYDSADTAKNITITPNSDGWVTLNGTADSAGVLPGGYKNVSVTGGHKYLAYVGGSSHTNQGFTPLGGNVPFDSIIRTAPSDGSTYFRFRTSNGTVYNNEKMCINVFDLTEMFGAGNEPATVADFRALFPKDYYAYTSESVKTCVSAVNGDEYRHLPITFPDAAGTVYGGTLTVNEDGTGVLRVDKKSRYITSGCVNGTTAGNGFRGQILYGTGNECKYDGSDTYGLCDTFINSYKGVINFNASTQSYYRCFAHSSGWFFTLPKSVASTNSEANAWLADNPVWFVYPLATPITYTLTAEQVGGILTTLKGENNVWADTGDIEVTVYGVPIVEPQADTLTSLNILLGGSYHNAGTADDVSDEEALNILLGGADR